jgi:predicted kinase
MPTLYLIRGLPGSGKSTFAWELEKAGVVDITVEADDYFINEETGEYQFDANKLHSAHRMCQLNAAAALAEGTSVGVSNTSTSEKEVAVYKKIAEQYNAKFVSIIVENRHEGKNIHGVPEDKLTQMRNRFSIKI